MRLTTALQRVYGRGVDIDELLSNAKLERASDSGTSRPRC